MVVSSVAFQKYFNRFFIFLHKKKIPLRKIISENVSVSRNNIICAKSCLGTKIGTFFFFFFVGVCIYLYILRTYFLQKGVTMVKAYSNSVKVHPELSHKDI
jgi:hypothetical protein